MANQERPLWERETIDILNSQPLGVPFDDEPTQDSELSFAEGISLVKGYRKLKKALTQIDALGKETKPYNFMGLKGDFYFNFSKESNEIQIVRKTPARIKGANNTMFLSLTHDGTAVYHTHPADSRQHKESGSINERSTHNKDLTVHRVLYTTDLICQAINENPPDVLIRKARDVRGFLMRYFETQGIVPKADKKSFKKIHPASNNRRNEKPHNVTTVGHTYNIDIKDMPGHWTVQFDIDDPLFMARAYDSYCWEHENRLRAHGTGIILERIYGPFEQPITETYVVWENGDMEFTTWDSNGNITNEGHILSFAEDDQLQLQTHNPHLPLIKFIQLQEAIRPPLPKSKIVLAAATDIAKVLRPER